MEQVEILTAVARAGIKAQWVAEAMKTNDMNQTQRRFIGLTRTALLNIKKPTLGRYTVRRAIDIQAVIGLIRSEDSQEFILKVNSKEPNDYLYRGNCFQALRQRLLALKPDLKVWTVEGDISRFRRTKYEKRNNCLRDIDMEAPDRGDLSDIQILPAQEDQI